MSQTIIRKFSRCPKCGSIYFYNNETDFEDFGSGDDQYSMVFTRCRCEECGCGWSDAYEMTSTTIYDED